MTPERLRLEREAHTLEAMVRLYCGGQHGTSNRLCPSCTELLQYALQRLERCPFQEGKTTCARCPVHCYAPDMRVRVRMLMRHAGPRMLLRHPAMTLRHWIDGLRRHPIRRRPDPR